MLGRESRSEAINDGDKIEDGKTRGFVVDRSRSRNKLFSVSLRSDVQSHVVVKPIITESPPASPIGDRPASSNHRSSIFSLRPSTARSVHSLATPSPRPSRFGRFRLSLPHIGSQSPEGAALGRSADNTRLSAASRLTNLGLTSTSLSSNSGPQSTEPSTLATSDTARHIRRSDGSVQEGTLEDLVEILTTGSGNSTRYIQCHVANVYIF
jgi:hypothetical protein